MEIRIIDFGTVESAAGMLVRAAERGVKTKPVMERIRLDLFKVEEAVVASQGRRGGGSWRKLKPDTIRKKGTTEILRTRGSRFEYNYRFANDNLYRAITQEGGMNMGSSTDTTVLFGTHIKYAEYVASMRPFLKFAAYDFTRWANWIREFLLSGINQENK